MSRRMIKYNYHFNFYKAFCTVFTKLASPLLGAINNLCNIFPIYKLSSTFLESGSSSRFIMAIIDTFFAETLLSWLTMLTNW